MWANFDTSNFPVVEVTMGIGELNESSWQKFKQDWLDLYDRGEKFEINFDTSNVGFVNPKYAFRTSNFITELKDTEEVYGKQLMNRSTIYCNSIYVKTLLNLIFKIKKPVCKIHITNIKLKFCEINDSNFVLDKTRPTQ